MKTRRVLAALILSASMCMKPATSLFAGSLDERDHPVPMQARPDALRRIALEVSAQRQTTGGKVLILIPQEYAGNREVLTLNERIKSALIFAHIPYDWAQSFYYPSGINGIAPHQVYVEVSLADANLFQVRLPVVPPLSGVDTKQFSDEAQAAAGVISDAPGATLNTGNPVIDKVRRGAVKGIAGERCHAGHGGGLFPGPC